jgi:hypothetical protein
MVDQQQLEYAKVEAEDPAEERSLRHGQRNLVRLGGDQAPFKKSEVSPLKRPNAIGHAGERRGDLGNAQASGFAPLSQVGTG